MRKSPLLLTVTLLLFLSISAIAQNDNSRLDAGSLVLKREFTQHIFIKGEDLEKMPFANLSEAINVWLNGAYTVASNLIFVVDGNIVSDVNAYSIHDIEEIVLLQNAGTLTGAGGSQQQMILITTRRGKGKFGIQGAAQTFLVHSPKATTNLYHQYYLGAYENLDKVSFGLSANYLRDVLPTTKQDGLHIVTPDNMNRWRFNGDFGWRPDAKNTIQVHVGFVPQSIDSAQNYTQTGTIYANTFTGGAHEHANQINTWARWRGEWFKGLRNDLQIGYLSELQKGTDNETAKYTGMDTLTRMENVTGDAHFHTDHLFIRDRLSYLILAGGWSFEPAVNASYEHFNDLYVETIRDETTVPGSGGLGGGGNTGISESAYATGYNGKIYVLTPTVDITYKHVLNIQGGVVANVSHATGTGVKRIFPFGSLALDLLRLVKAESRNSLKLFGSYAKSSAFNLVDWQLNDLSGGNALFAYSAGPASQGGIYTGGTTFLPAGPAPTNFWVWQTGARFASFKDRVTVSYNFERRNFPTIGSTSYIGTTVYAWSNWTSSQHYLNVSARIVDGAVFSWQSGVNTTVLRSKADVYSETMISEPVGDFYKGNTKPSWTGGWTNRLRYKDLSMGLDLFYHFSGEVIQTPIFQTTYFSRENSWLMQNIYIGRRLHLPKNMGLEVYVDGRGLVRGGNTSYQMDSRRYFGVGGKISM